MSPSCTSILRIGPAEAPETLQLREALLSFLAADGSPKVQTKHGFKIANRYFQAEVRLEYTGRISDSRDTWKEDGIILVFPNDLVASQYSFDSLAAIHHAAVSAKANNASAGELLRLCVAVSSEPLPEAYIVSKQYEHEYARRIHWCLDRGYEYVECNLLDINQGHDDRDKEGFARIVETIRGTVWSSAVMAPKKTEEEVGLKISYQQDESVIGDCYVNEYEPPDPRNFPTISDATIDPSTEIDRVREELARQELMAEFEADTLIPIPKDGADPNLKANQDRERYEEKIFNAMECTLKQAAQIRETSRAGSMTDSQRRQRAGDAATLLYRMMEELEFDESDDDGARSENDSIRVDEKFGDD
ncbi:hypothetical protein MPSEU_000515700 [Mayamaea pseudoterrestris]|nr:hypothetical protein MPSEU_000515700 [Mayamaea pseudoterrestris]